MILEMTKTLTLMNRDFVSTNRIQQGIKLLSPIQSLTKCLATN